MDTPHILLMVLALVGAVALVHTAVTARSRSPRGAARLVLDEQRARFGAGPLPRTAPASTATTAPTARPVVESPVTRIARAEEPAEVAVLTEAPVDESFWSVVEDLEDVEHAEVAVTTEVEAAPLADVRDVRDLTRLWAEQSDEQGDDERGTAAA
ncbi:MAG: hypothetical protein CMH83_17750 [Nocardioides sp.]|nr:hypothetical protein [Nocardioides sp.]